MENLIFFGNFDFEKWHYQKKHKKQKSLKLVYRDQEWNSVSKNGRIMF